MPTATQSPPTTLTDAELAAMRAEAEQLVEELGTINYERGRKTRRLHILKAALPKELSASLVIPDARPVWGPCTRCGHQWRGHSLNPPRACARCGSSGWQVQSRYKNARKPSDPPNPYWQKHHRRERTELSKLAENLVRIGGASKHGRPRQEVVFPPPLPPPPLTLSPVPEMSISPPPTPPPPMPARAVVPLASVRFDGEAQPERTVSREQAVSELSQVLREHIIPMVEEGIDVVPVLMDMASTIVVEDPRERLNRMRFPGQSPIDNVVEEELIPLVEGDGTILPEEGESDAESSAT